MKQSSRWLQRAAQHALITGILLSSESAMAIGLQVSPVSLSLQANENASGLTLMNTGNDPVHAQVRVYQWSQDKDGDQLKASRGLLASPPMIELQPGEQQLIRIIRAVAPPSGSNAVEASYRVFINELPIKAAVQTNASQENSSLVASGTEEQKKTIQGLNFVVSYSLPVFVNPVGVTATNPTLQWHYTLQPDNQQMVMRVTNNGNGHAQLADLSVTNADGEDVSLHHGLLGYVLPGATMQWTLNTPATITQIPVSQVKVMINGNNTTQRLTLDSPTH